MSDLHEELVHEFANIAATRTATSAMKYLIKSKHTLSAEDSGLKNTWDEICVQVQDIRTYFWDGYVASMRDAVLSAMMSLGKIEIAAIWLQTDEGNNWSRNLTDPEFANAFPDPTANELHELIDEEYVAEYIINQHLESLAFKYSNERIRGFLHRTDDLW